MKGIVEKKYNQFYTSIEFERKGLFELIKKEAHRLAVTRVTQVKKKGPRMASQGLFIMILNKYFLAIYSLQRPYNQVQTAF